MSRLDGNLRHEAVKRIDLRAVVLHVLVIGEKQARKARTRAGISQCQWRAVEKNKASLSVNNFLGTNPHRRLPLSRLVLEHRDRTRGQAGQDKA